MIEVFQEVEHSMKHAVDHFRGELKQVRTGRASLSLLEGVTVDSYGTLSQLNHVANLQVADANLIVISPWDSSQIGAIERAIQTADLGLNPSNDGKVIRLPIPALTEERRQEMVRRVHEMAEGARNVVRQARRDGNDLVKALEKDKEIGEDDERRGHDEIQKLHDHYIGEVNKAAETKESQVLQT